MIRALALLLSLAIASPAGAFDAFTEATIDPQPGAQVPLSGRLLDENGNPTSLAELGRGKPIVLAPILHDCPNICGVTMAGLAQAIRAQAYEPGRDFTVVAFGIDPDEGPEQAAASRTKLLGQFPSLPPAGLHAVTGNATVVSAVTDALGYHYAWDDEIGQYAHIAAVAVLTADGKLSRWLYGLAPAPNDLKLALTEAGQGAIGSWQDQLLLLCYHYDPTTGRYGSLVWTMLRVGGGMTALAVGGFIAVALLRDRKKRVTQ